jgi:hypothetical protein
MTALTWFEFEAIPLSTPTTASCLAADATSKVHRNAAN